MFWISKSSNVGLGHTIGVLHGILCIILGVWVLLAVPMQGEGARLREALMDGGRFLSLIFMRVVSRHDCNFEMNEKI